MTPMPPIPGDLQALYADALDAHAYADSRQRANEVKHLVERIAKLTAEVALLERAITGIQETAGKQEEIIERLEAENTRLKAPVSEFLVPEFLKAMSDIGRYGFEKYGDQSFQARRNTGDISRGPLERCTSINICLHGAAHFDAYLSGDEHDHFGTLEYQLAAAAFNAMMEFYFAGFASRATRTPQADKDAECKD